MTYRLSLGQNSFDTVHYLSMVVDNSNSYFLSYKDYSTGLLNKEILIQYDFQTYYILLGFILKMLQKFQLFIVRDFQYSTLVPTIIRVSTIFNFLLTSTILYQITNYFFNNKKMLKSISLVLSIFIYTTYYNTTFAFFGNSFRLIFISYWLFEIYKITKSKVFGYYDALIFFGISSTLIAFTSSGLFLSIIILISFSIWAILNIENVWLKLIIIFIPSELFGLFFLSANNPSNYVIIILILIIVNLFLYLLSSNKYLNFITTILRKKNILFLIFALPIYQTSIYFWLTGFKPQYDFFTDHTRYDMVWYFFDFSSFKGFLTNSVYWGLFIYFIIKSKDEFKKLIFVMIILFINPITLPFLYKFLTNTVYYRTFELVFNPFTITLFVFHLYSKIINIKFRYLISSVLILIFTTLSLINIFTYSNKSFIPTEDYNPLLRIDNSQYEVLNVLNTKIILENYKPAKVISQIEFFRGFVSNTITPISNQILRMTNKYDVNPEPSKLINIFINRDYIGQDIYDVKPDYDNTCNYLIEEKVDFVIVSKEQYLFDENGNVIPLFFKVRDCGTNIFENNRYILYQFYWR